MKKLITLAVLTGCLQMPTTTYSADFDFSGQFAQDNEVLRFNFSLGQSSIVTLFTSSWSVGGFDPILGLWDSTGQLLLEQDDSNLGGTLTSNGITYHYGEFDSYINLALDAGDYIATLAQYDNFSASTLLADGFLRDADPNFTAAFDCPNGRFCQGSLLDANDDPVDPNRTPNWSLHILNVDTARPNAVTEPPTAMLLGLAGLFFLNGLCRTAARYSKQTNNFF